MWFGEPDRHREARVKGISKKKQQQIEKQVERMLKDKPVKAGPVQINIKENTE